MGLVLGIDVSTTATKAVLIDEAGRGPSGSGVAEYAVRRPAAALERAGPRALVGRRDDGHPVGARLDRRRRRGRRRDRADRPDARGWSCSTRPARSSARRSCGTTSGPAAECDAIRPAVGPERLIAITGNDALTGFTAPKLVWVRDHEPDVWRRVAHVLLPKDYVRLRLTGDYAARQGGRRRHAPVRPGRPRLVGRRCWPPCGSTRPGCRRRSRGRRSPASSRRSRGRGDRPPGRHAGGRRRRRPGGERGRRRAVSAGTMALSLGTSGVVFAATDRPLFEPHGRVHAFCHAVPGRWHLMSVMLSAAGSLRWFRDAVAPGVDVRRPGRAGGRGAGRQRRPVLPALPVRRAQPAPGSAGPRRVRRADPAPRSAPPHPGRPRGVAFGLRDGLDLMVGRRDAGAEPDPGVRRRHGEPALAPDPGRRPGRRDRHGQHHRGRRLRRGPAGGGRRRLVSRRRGRDDGARQGDARRLTRSRRRATPRPTPSTATSTRPWPRPSAGP